MNTNKIALPAVFGVETRFELLPVAPFRQTNEAEFQRLKRKLLAKSLRAAGLKSDASLHNAANEAAALAWTTSFPLLVFPALFEEKTAAAALQNKRQAGILRKSRELLAA